MPRRLLGVLERYQEFVCNGEQIHVRDARREREREREKECVWDPMQCKQSTKDGDVDASKFANDFALFLPTSITPEGRSCFPSRLQNRKQKMKRKAPGSHH